MEVVANPDEVYRDPTGAVHALKRLYKNRLLAEVCEKV